MEIKKVRQELERQGYALVDQRCGAVSDEEYFRFIHKDSFELVLVQKENIDDGDFFCTAFNVCDDEVEEMLRERLKIPQIKNRKQKMLIEAKMFDWADMDFRAVVKELVGKTAMGVD